MNRLLFLKNVSLFRHLSFDDLLVINQSLGQAEFLEGETIFFEGTAGYEFYIVLEGSVRICKKSGASEVHIAELGPAECFGEMSLFDDAPRSATAVAAGACTLLSLERNRFLTLIAQRPAIGLQLCKVLSIRLREADQKLAMNVCA